MINVNLIQLQQHQTPLESVFFPYENLLYTIILQGEILSIRFYFEMRPFHSPVDQ
jgi:hypothetical protein